MRLEAEPSASTGVHFPPDLTPRNKPSRMFEHIDLYCERVTMGFWGEPLNATSNLAFFLAAGFAILYARRKNRLSGEVWLLITLIVLIGVGSALFHTLATRWAMVADILPIGIFQVAFLVCYLRRAMDRQLPVILAAGFLFFGLVIGVDQLPKAWLNGSLTYMPALLFLGGFGIWHLQNSPEARYSLLAATGVFAVSLTCRALDRAFCEHLPFGIHFIWHVLNALVLVLTVQGYVAGTRSGS